MKTIKKFIPYIILFIILSSLNVWQYFNPVIEKEVIKINKEIDTTAILNKFKAQLTPNITTEPKGDTFYIPYDVDDLIAEAKEEAINDLIEKHNIDTSQVSVEEIDTLLSQQNYIAETDTIITDSTGVEKSHIVIEFVSPIPLHSSSFFRVAWSWWDREINTTITKEIETKRLFEFAHGISAGFGYGVIHKNFDVYLGYSATLQLNLSTIFR